MGQVITLDGPAGAGKSTVGKLFAQKIGFQFLDTGILYRAGAAFITDHHLSISDKLQLIDVFSHIDLVYQQNGEIQTYVKGEDVTPALHTDQTSRFVPEVAAIKEVRELVKEIQLHLAQTHNMVIAGRDIGSEIFPDTDCKFYITASAEMRARRRFEQLKSTQPHVTFAEILTSTKERDLKDMTREISPMRKPDGAITIDTTEMNVDQVVEEMMKTFSKQPDNLSS